MTTIVIPEQGQPPTSDDQLRSALYATSMYGTHVTVVCGHRVGVLLSEHAYKQLLRDANRT